MKELNWLKRKGKIHNLESKGQNINEKWNNLS